MINNISKIRKKSSTSNHKKEIKTLEKEEELDNIIQ